MSIAIKMLTDSPGKQLWCIYLFSSPVFSHGQVEVALSQSNIKILLNTKHPFQRQKYFKAQVQTSLFEHLRIYESNAFRKCWNIY